jgi:hypothetical protein
MTLADGKMLPLNAGAMLQQAAQINCLKPWIAPALVV